MGLKIRPVRKITTLNLSRPTQPVRTEEERIEALQKVVDRMKTRLQAKVKGQRQK